MMLMSVRLVNHCLMFWRFLEDIDIEDEEQGLEFLFFNVIN